MGKGEIPRYEQFSFSHSVFKRLVLQTRKNQDLFGKGLNNHCVKPRLHRNRISCEYTRIFEFGWIREHSVLPPRMDENSGAILKHSWKDSACFEMFKTRTNTPQKNGPEYGPDKFHSSHIRDIFGWNSTAFGRIRGGVRSILGRFGLIRIVS